MVSPPPRSRLAVSGLLYLGKSSRINASLKGSAEAKTTGMAAVVVCRGVMLTLHGDVLSDDDDNDDDVEVPRQTLGAAFHLRRVCLVVSSSAPPMEAA